MKDVKDLEERNSIPSPGIPGSVSVQGGTKEAPKGSTSEFVRPSEQGKNLDNEVAEAGVQQVKEAPILDEQHEQLGVKHSGADIPVKTEPTGTISLPMTDDEAEAIIKEHKNRVTVDIGQHGEEQAYIIPSSLGRATLIHKIYKLFGLLRRKTA